VLDETVARRLALLGAELDRAKGLTAAPPAGGDGEAAPRAAVPTPGRHAAPGRLTLSAAQVAVVGTLVITLIGAGAWWLGSGDEARVAQPVAPATGNLVSVSTAPAVAGDASTAAASVTVDVAGKVRRPGIAVLDAGSRVVDALEAAGGARAGVDLTALNLARVLVDGEQILVGVDPPSGVAATATGSGAPVPTQVNLNTADQVALESLPGVGPVTAQAILTWRSEHGAFTSVDQLLDVDGIGEATLAKLTPYVTL
jgi:competence protein ComEA